MPDKWEWLLIGLAIGVPVGIVVLSIVTRARAGSVSAEPVTTMMNDEDWVISRDQRGTVTGVRVIRTVHQL